MQSLTQANSSVKTCSCCSCFQTSTSLLAVLLTPVWPLGWSSCCMFCVWTLLLLHGKTQWLFIADQMRGHEDSLWENSPAAQTTRGREECMDAGWEEKTLIHKRWLVEREVSSEPFFNLRNPLFSFWQQEVFSFKWFVCFESVRSEHEQLIGSEKQVNSALYMKPHAHIVRDRVRCHRLVSNH